MIRCTSEKCENNRYDYATKERICVKTELRFEQVEDNGYDLVCHTFEERDEDEA